MNVKIHPFSNEECLIQLRYCRVLRSFFSAVTEILQRINYFLVSKQGMKRNFVKVKKTRYSMQIEWSIWCVVLMHTDFTCPLEEVDYVQKRFLLLFYLRRLTLILMLESKPRYWSTLSITTIFQLWGLAAVLMLESLTCEVHAMLHGDSPIILF